MGTSDLYRAVEEIPEILDSLVVNLEYLGRESYMPLFIVLRPECELTDELKLKITARVRTALSARHVPSDIFQVEDVPRTLSGKKLELPIKKLLLGQSLDRVVNLDAVKDQQKGARLTDRSQRKARGMMGSIQRRLTASGSVNQWLKQAKDLSARGC
ncbi:hypothetical protein [Pseudomonas hormoni]